MKLFTCGITVTMSLVVVHGFLFNGHHRYTPTTLAPGEASSPEDCARFSEYHAVRGIPKHHPCTSETQVWEAVDKLRRKSLYCLNVAVNACNSYVAHHPTHCSCTGTFREKDPHQIAGHRDHLNCLRSTACKTLADRYYNLNGFISHGHENIQCETHAKVWPLLEKTGVVDGFDTRGELVLHLGNDFRGSNGDECKCKAIEQVHTSKVPDTTTKTPSTTTRSTSRPTTRSTSRPTTRSTSRPTTHAEQTTPQSTELPTTTTESTTAEPQVHIGQLTCRSVDTITDISTQRVAENAQASACPSSGNKTSPEAFVLDHCDLKSPALWKQGANVMKYCSRIPPYMPVATFINNKYTSAGSLSGIFLGCLDNGFRLGFQRCDDVPVIEHIDRGGLFTRDPDLYYIVE